LWKGVYEERHYLLTALFEHAIPIKDKSESRKVRENRVRKPYGWDSVELGTCKIVQGYCNVTNEGMALGPHLRITPEIPAEEESDYSKNCSCEEHFRTELVGHVVRELG